MGVKQVTIMGDSSFMGGSYETIRIMGNAKAFDKVERC